MRKFFLALFLVLSVAFVISVDAVAQTPAPSTPSTPAATSSGTGEDAAREIYCNARDLMMGNMGVMIGLLISAAGLYNFLLKDQTTGGFMILAGVLLTALPGLYMGFLESYEAAFGDGGSAVQAPTCP